MDASSFFDYLKAQKVKTWFDLGLFLDGLRYRRETNYPLLSLNYEGFKLKLREGGIALVTFEYGIDGVSIEILKYASALHTFLPGTKIHYVSGKFHPFFKKKLRPNENIHALPDLGSFDEWALYELFFKKTLERGDETYNHLIADLWKETLSHSQHLARYVESHRIGLLYLVNVCSNPGNLALTLSCILVSELLDIPVVNNNHDFYFESGHSDIEKKEKNLPDGPRDLFFRNAHLGEVISLLENTLPWRSRIWFTLNINTEQSKRCIERLGHNPANVAEVDTALDPREFLCDKDRKRQSVMWELQSLFNSGRKTSSFSTRGIDEVIRNASVANYFPRPVVVSAQKKSVEDFMKNNIILLQPTRIIRRKRIEMDFSLIRSLLMNGRLGRYFEAHRHVNISLLVTGPISIGQNPYFHFLLKQFRSLLESIGKELANRIHLAFLFSAFDDPAYREKTKSAIGMADIYRLASMVLFPSETEGRGLPIIEAAAAGVPILTRRYHPEAVYRQVIGESMEESKRLRVLELGAGDPSDSLVDEVAKRILHPHQFQEEVDHNRRVVEYRYGLETMMEGLDSIFEKLHLQLIMGDNSRRLATAALNRFAGSLNKQNAYLRTLVDERRRQFLPGYGQTRYMIYLKSLIDPSFFRVEEMHLRGMIFKYARTLMERIKKTKLLSMEKEHRFYNAVEQVFTTPGKEMPVQFDHSFSYRRRHRLDYPYQEYTYQELTGIANDLFKKIFSSPSPKPANEGIGLISGREEAMGQLTGALHLEIDNRHRLIERLNQNIPFVYFFDKYPQHELRFFLLETLRLRLGLSPSEHLDETYIRKHKKEIRHLAPIYAIAPRSFVGPELSYDQIQAFIAESSNKEIKAVFQRKLVHLLPSEQTTVGIHLFQLGKTVLRALRQVQRRGGFLAATGEDAAMMTDFLDMERFFLGQATRSLSAKIMGIPIGAGFVQWIPSGLRPTLAYPTPIQTARDMDLFFQSSEYQRVCKKWGEKSVLDHLRQEAIESGMPLTEALHSLEQARRSSIQVEKHPLRYRWMNGKHRDGTPWNGVVATAMPTQEKGWIFFAAMNKKNQTETVTSMMENHNRRYGTDVQLGWNGGYILNAELVGKLGLSEACVGSPLGFLVTQGKILCPPLFNKACLLIYEDGRVDIQRVNCFAGIRIREGKKWHTFTCRNRPEPIPQVLQFYDLLYSPSTIPGDGRVIVRMTGSMVYEVIPTRSGESVPFLPIGLHLSFPRDRFPASFNRVGKHLSLEILNLDHVEYAVEAGPLLVEDDRESIDMETEGWTCIHSIRTQAARLDYRDIRGPKIGAGLDERGVLSVLVVNGRIRESVGATHEEMAEIFLSLGMKKAMGFDPGGSATLVVGDRALNISPYNRNYERDIYALPPEPRGVASAVFGYLKKEVRPDGKEKKQKRILPRKGEESSKRGII